MENNLFDIFRINSERTLLRDESHARISYQEIINFSRKFNINNGKKSIILTIVNNSIDGLTGYLAALLSGNVPLMVDTKLTRDQIDQIIFSYNPELIWASTSRANELPNWSIKFSLGEYSLFWSNFQQQRPTIHDELALLLSTSGSTGTKKYVRISLRNILSNAKSIANYLELSKLDCAITTLPPSYSYALSIIHSHMFVGGSLAVTKKTFFDKEFWNFIKVSQATNLSGVPYHYEILRKLRFFKMELPNLRILTQAGGPMRKELTQEFAEYSNARGIRFFTMYGQTEASPRISYVPSEKAFEKAGTIGIPIPGGTLELQTESGNELIGANLVGELVYRGANVCMGYADSRYDLSLGDVNCSILHTGDLAERDEDGYYRIVGRQKRFIKIYGNRVNLQDVELRLLTFESELACSGRDDLLEVYLVANNFSRAREIKKELMASLRVGAQAIAIYELRALPRNESGKVQYSELHPENARLLA
jgi:long-chain acyl-CoA synthetase